VPQDYGEAVHWYRKAAEQGFGRYSLGYMYHHGQGVAQNYAEAARWYLCG
jgi:TPR repeat protein